jgi:exonuclease SbcC
MKLISLSLREWRSFESCDLEFPDGLIGVRGANGSGKTTIAEAIGWALFGKMRPGAKVGDLKRQGATAASSVELVFRLGPTVYRVRRVVSGAATFWIGDGDDPESTQTRATNQAIVRELGIGWESFQRTVFARQKDVAALDPSATKQSRTEHVERLLGLRRYRDASSAAKTRAKDLASQLQGLREQAPNLADLREQLKLAQEAAASGDPAVKAAKAHLEQARASETGAEAMVDVERERAAASTALVAQEVVVRGALSDTASDLVQRRASAEKRVVDAARLEIVRASAPELDAVRQTQEQWKALEACQLDLAALGEDDGSYDGVAAGSRAARLTAIRDEMEHLDAAVLPDPAALDARVKALEASAVLPAAAKASAAADAIEHERDSARGHLAALRDRLDSDIAHLGALEESGANVPCPICLRPYGDDFETIRAQHEVRLTGLRDEVEVLELRCVELETERTAARVLAARAKEAADVLARTPGLDDLDEARALAATAGAAIAARTVTLTALRAERAQLEVAVTEDVAAERATAQARARRDAAQARYNTAASALGVESFDPVTLEAASTALSDAERLTYERRDLEASLRATEGLAAEIATLEERHDERADELDDLTTKITELAIDPVRLAALKLAHEAAERAVEQASEALQEARLLAQGSDQAVGELRDRVDEATAIHATIDERAREHREHSVAAELLADFRSAQSARAWPNLEQGASVLLSDTTDGRYADVRMSKDYKLEVIDRGERFGLERYSGGEQDLANLCLRLAIADWVARERDTELGFVVLDEVFGSQDEDRRQRLLDALRSLGARFHQLMVITHVPDIADRCDHQLVVTLAEPGRSVAEIRSS